MRCVPTQKRRTERLRLDRWDLLARVDSSLMALQALACSFSLHLLATPKCAWDIPTHDSPWPSTSKPPPKLIG